MREQGNVLILRYSSSKFGYKGLYYRLDKVRYTTQNNTTKHVCITTAFKLQTNESNENSGEHATRPSSLKSRDPPSA